LDKRKKYWQLFLSTFKLSACTFGGFVIIPKCFVDDLHWGLSIVQGFWRGFARQSSP